jgi:hypothetical protein
VRRGHPLADKVSVEDRFSKLRCGCCMKPLSESTQQAKAVNKGATYWVCGVCAKELRADSKDVWDCPTAAEGKSGCLCWCAAAKKQQMGGGKRKKGGQGFKHEKGSQHKKRK